MMLKTCCCCISLRTGSIVVGSLSLIAAIMNAITIGRHINKFENLDEDDDNYSRFMVFKIFTVTLMIYILTAGIFSGLMIAGTFKRIAGYFFPWLAVGFVTLVITITITLAFVIVTSSQVPLDVFFGVLVFLMATTVLQIHLWLVVYSHYKEIIAEKYGHQSRPSDGEILGEAIKHPYYNV